MLTKNSHKNGVDVPYGNSVLLDSSENAPESRRLGKAFRLGAYGPPLEKYVFAATHKHPMSVLPEPDVMGMMVETRRLVTISWLRSCKQTLLSMETTCRGHSHLR